MQIYSTQDVHANGVKMLVYGQSGAGKTTLIKTLPNPIILSAESGLLSLAGTNLPYIPIKKIDDVHDAYRYLTQDPQGQQFQSIALDSISEIAEVVLTQEKANCRDPRQAYGAMQDIMSDIIRKFRDIPGRHVYFSAKLEKNQDELGRILYAPSLPGKSFSQQLSYFFDLVLALRVEKSQEGTPMRMLMCDSDGLWQAKNRGGRLETWEPCDLGAIINKINGQNP
jgi:phage nucleotide-binding protein